MPRKWQSSELASKGLVWKQDWKRFHCHLCPRIRISLSQDQNIFIPGRLCIRKSLSQVASVSEKQYWEFVFQTVLCTFPSSSTLNFFYQGKGKSCNFTLIKLLLSVWSSHETVGENSWFMFENPTFAKNETKCCILIKLPSDWWVQCYFRKPRKYYKKSCIKVLYKSPMQKNHINNLHWWVVCN